MLWNITNTLFSFVLLLKRSENIKLIVSNLCYCENLWNSFLQKKQNWYVKLRTSKRKNLYQGLEKTQFILHIPLEFGFVLVFTFFFPPHFLSYNYMEEKEQKVIVFGSNGEEWSFLLCLTRWQQHWALDNTMVSPILVSMDYCQVFPAEIRDLKSITCHPFNLC